MAEEITASAGVVIAKPAPKYNKITVLPDDQEYAIVTEMGKRTGLGVSTYLRTLIRKEHNLGDFGNNVAAG